MKIALVSPYDFAYPGGVANHISNLDRYLCRMGHEVKVIAPASKAVTTFGNRFIPIGKPRPIPNSGSIARITLSLTLASKIKTVLDEEKFDIIHLMNLSCLCCAVPCCASQIPSISVPFMPATPDQATDLLGLSAPSC